MSQKLAKLVFEKSNKTKSVPEVIHPIFAGKHLPDEHLAYISDKEAKMLRDNTDGKSNLTQWGPSSFVNMGPTAGMGSNYTPTSAYTYSPPSTNVGPTGGLGSNYTPTSSYTYSAPRPATSSSQGGGSYYGGNFGTGYVGSGSNSSYSGASSYGSNTGGQGSSSGSGNSSGSNNSGGGWTISTGQGNSNTPSSASYGSNTTGNGSQSSINKIIDNVLSFVDAKPAANNYPTANWNVSASPNQVQQKSAPPISIIQQGINYSPADYMAAGYREYQQPPSMAQNQVASKEPSKDASFSDWQVSYPSNSSSPLSAFADAGNQIAFSQLSNALNPPSSSPSQENSGYGNLASLNYWSQPATAPKLYTDKIGSPAPQTQTAQMANAYRQYQQPPNDPRLSPAPSFNINSDPQPIQNYADNSYLTGPKMGSQDAVEDYRTPSYIAWQNSQVPSYLTGPKVSSADQIQQASVDGYDSNGNYTYPNGQGREVPADGLGANPAGYTIASAADLGKGGAYMPSKSPFDQVAYDEKLQQVTDANNSSLPVKLAGFASRTPLGAAGLGIAGLIQKATGGLYGNDVYSSGSNPNYASNTNQGGQNYGQFNNDGIKEGSGNDPFHGQTYTSKDEFIASLKNRHMDSRKIDELWAKYLKLHPATGTTATASTGPVGAAYSIATAKGNYIVDSRGNYFMMGPDRSYVSVPPPTGV